MYAQKNKYSAVSWQALESECARLKCTPLVRWRGFDEGFLIEKLKLQKKHPELNERIEQIVGKDPFLDYWLEEKRIAQERLNYCLFMVISVGIMIFNQKVGGVLFCIAFVLAFISKFEKPSLEGFNWDPEYKKALKKSRG
ncbi:MAG: hypothetical protein HGB12_14190 [Bacteroidetes bacterium]|nr:hypothetical protein [Bacteroidota bacterium]